MDVPGWSAGPTVIHRTRRMRRRCGPRKRASRKLGTGCSLRTTYEHVVRPAADDRNRWTKRARVAPPLGLLLLVRDDSLVGVDRDACLLTGAGAPVTSGNCPSGTFRGWASAHTPN